MKSNEKGIIDVERDVELGENCSSDLHLEIGKGDEDLEFLGLGLC